MLKRGNRHGSLPNHDLEPPRGASDEAFQGFPASSASKFPLPTYTFAKEAFAKEPFRPELPSESVVGLSALLAPLNN